MSRPASRMRAAVLAAPERVEVREVPVPDPGPGEVRVRLAGCGVCASSLPVFEGRPWFRYPMDPGLPGHEAWGHVDAAGRGSRWREGDRIALLSQHGYAEWDLATDEEAVAVPQALDGLPFPGEAIGCALNVLRRAEIRAGHRVAVVGAGFLGLLLVQLCRARDARAFAVSRRTWALHLARECGAEETAHVGTDAAERIREWTRGAGCERVVEATGTQDGLDLASDVVGVRGRLVIAGYHQDGMRSVNLQQWNWRGIDVVNAHERELAERARGMREAAQATMEGVVDPSPLLTHALPLDDLGRALRLTRERPDGFLKAWIDCGDGR